MFLLECGHLVVINAFIILQMVILGPELFDERLFDVDDFFLVVELRLHHGNFFREKIDLQSQGIVLALGLVDQSLQIDVSQ